MTERYCELCGEKVVDVIHNGIRIIARADRHGKGTEEWWEHSCNIEKRLGKED